MRGCLQIALAVGDDTLRPTVPSGTPPALVNICALCFEPEADMRPSFGVLVQLLQHALAALPSDGEGQGVLGRIMSGIGRSPPTSPQTPQPARVST